MHLPITVIQCVNSLDVGGVEQIALTLARYLHGDRFRSRICCIEERGALADQAEAEDIPVHALQMQQHGKWRGWASLCALLRLHHPAVIHSHNFKPFYYSALARMAGAADVHVHTRHGAWTKSHRAQWRYRPLRRWADGLVTVSEEGRHQLHAQSGLALAKIGVVPNGIDTARFQPSTDRAVLRQRLSLPADCPAIITVARLAPEKDLGTLLQAFQLVMRTVPTAELWIVGDGPERVDLKNRSHELGINERTRLLGTRTDVEHLLSAADLFALPSVSEGLSVALIEAASCGLPIVATSVGGNGEIVNPPHGGTLIKPRDAAALAAALTELLGDEPKRRQMAVAARAHAVERFSVAAMVDRYRTMYETQLAGHGRLC